MNEFLKQYGQSIIVIIFTAILISFSSPLGQQLQLYTENRINHITEIADDEQYLQGYGRPKEPERTVNQVYCILYDDGEMTISQNETTPDSSRTVVKKGFYSRPSVCSSKMTTVRFTEAVKPKSCQMWFYDCNQLTNIENLNYLYTNECITMSSMFFNCSKLTTLDVSNFDTSNVTIMWKMFSACSSLTALDVSNFDTSNVTTMNYMFENCSKLTVDCSHFDISKVTSHDCFKNNAPGVTAPDPSWT